VITTLLVLQTGQLNRHSPPPSSRGTKTLRCIRTSQVWHFGLGIPVSAAVCMLMVILAARLDDSRFRAGPCRFSQRLCGPGYSSERSQQIIGAVIDDRAGPPREGHDLLGALTVHVGAIDRKQPYNNQGRQKPSHPRCGWRGSPSS
jgi:hypothetical protein